MGLLTRLIDALTGNEAIKPEPFVKHQAQPIHINAPAHVAITRMTGRLVNLYGVRNPSTEVLHSIEDYKASIATYGHTPPNNLQEAEALAERIKG